MSVLEPTNFIREDILIRERKVIHSYNGTGAAIGSEIEAYQQENICEVVPHSFESNKVKMMDLDLQGDELSSFVHVKNGFILVTLANEFYYLEIGSEQAQKLNVSLAEGSPRMGPLLITYNPKSEYVYLVSESRLHYFRLDGQMLECPLQHSGIVSAASSQSLLILASVSSIHIYSVDSETGAVKFERTVDGRDLFGTDA